MTYPDATAIWEDKLHSMSEGDGSLEDFLTGQVDFTTKLCAAATTAKFTESENIFKCPNCGSALAKRKGKNGEFFWGCTNYPECKATFDDDNGKPNFLNENAPKCPNCGSALAKRKGKDGNFFWGCTNYPECKTAFEDYGGKPDFDKKNFSERLLKEGAPKCPNCGNALVKRKDKDGNFFWGCANYPECKTTFDDSSGKPNFLNENAPKCPNCGSALVKRKGKNGEFWGCSAYPKCKTTFNDKDGKPDFNGKKFLPIKNSTEPKNFNSADFEPIISSADFV